MKSFARHTLLGSLLTMLTVGASIATTITVTQGPLSPVADAEVSSFEFGLPSSFSMYGPNAGVASSTVIGSHLQPVAATSYAYVGPDSQITATFASGISYLGFEWGSPDFYNTLTVVAEDGVTTIYGLDGISVPGLDTNGRTSQFLNLSFEEPILSASWNSAFPAFEFTNVSTLPFDAPTTDPTPEPPSWALLICGLLIAFAGAFRRWTAGDR